MQRNAPQILQVQVPTDFSAIAIIDLHPSAPQAHNEGETGRPLFASWASGTVSALKRQQGLRPLLAYQGEAEAHFTLFQGFKYPKAYHAYFFRRYHAMHDLGTWASLHLSAYLSKHIFACAGVAQVSVACAKSNLVAIFQILVKLKQRLGFQTSKRDIILQPAGDRLQLAMHNLVLQMLQESGWQRLQRKVLLCKQRIPHTQNSHLTS